MLGLGDGWVLTAYILCILSAIMCFVYGILNWNKGGEETADEETKDWMKEEIDIEKNM